MIFMLDTPDDLTECESEMGMAIEQLFTPLTRRNAQRPGAHFAMDNGAFSRFNPDGFRTMLAKHWDRRELCRFVALPDVVGSARRTLELFDHWYPQTEGWKRALVAQDGIENLTIPWSLIDAIFIGGSTKWKMSKDAEDVIRATKACDKWAHVGRINTPGRLEHFQPIGADSGDGTGPARFSHMREAIYKAATEPTLFSQAG